MDDNRSIDVNPSSVGATQPALLHHPRSRSIEESLAHARSVAGVIKLHGPVPSTKFLGDEGDEVETTSHAGH